MGNRPRAIVIIGRLSVLGMTGMDTRVCYRNKFTRLFDGAYQVLASELIMQSNLRCSDTEPSFELQHPIGKSLEPYLRLPTSIGGNQSTVLPDEHKSLRDINEEESSSKEAIKTVYVGCCWNRPTRDHILFVWEE